MDLNEELRRKRMEDEHLKNERERLEILHRQERRSLQKNTAIGSNDGGGCLSAIIIIALIVAGIYYFISGKESKHAVHPTQQIQSAQNQNKTVSPIQEHGYQTITNKNSQDSEAAKSDIKTINKMF